MDGFRFDLMGILDYNLMNEISEECKKLKPDFMIYGKAGICQALWRKRFVLRN